MWKWLDSLGLAFRGPEPGRRRARFRLAVECLEDRCVPAAVGYLQTNLVSDVPGGARVTDANLVNPWGIAASPTGPFWVADNGTGVSTLYNSAGTPNPLVVT